MGQEICKVETDIIKDNYTAEEKQLIKDTVARGTTDTEFKLFLYVCNVRQLNPLTGQIHCVKRWDSNLEREAMTIQTGIDGFRLIAQRAAKANHTPILEVSDPVYEDSEDPRLPNKATVTVVKKVDGEKASFTASARWREYVANKKDGQPVYMWRKMPFLMLGKCAEALALRKAFPEDLGDIYTDEEMAQADNAPPQEDPIEAAQPADPVHVSNVVERVKEKMKKPEPEPEQDNIVDAEVEEVEPESEPEINRGELIQEIDLLITELLCDCGKNGGPHAEDCDGMNMIRRKVWLRAHGLVGWESRDNMELKKILNICNTALEEK